MKEKSMDKLIGKYCKIVTQEPGDVRVHVFYGEITDIDYDAGFIIVESDEGTGIIKIDSIEAIKPGKKNF